MPEVLPHKEHAEQSRSIEGAVDKDWFNKRRIFQVQLMAESGMSAQEWIDANATNFGKLVDADNEEGTQLRDLIRNNPEEAKEKIVKLLEEMKDKEAGAAAIN